MRPALRIIWIAGIALIAHSGLWLHAQSAPESYSFSAAPGDTLVIQNDYGRIQIRGTDGTQLQASLRKTPAARSGFETVVQQSGDKIFFYSFFSGNPGESVDLEIQAPRLMNVVIWGANPSVDLSDIQGFVRTQNFTGSISAENLTSSVSLISDRGDIHYRATAQPQGDIRLETVAGSVSCELASSINLRAWLRAGGRIRWEREEELRATSIEKQIGTFGPLLYAGSLRSDVTVTLREGTKAPSPAPAMPVPSRQPAPQAPPPVREPAPQQSAQQSRGEETVQPSAQPQSRPATAPAEAAPAQGGGFALKVDVDSVFMNVSVRDRRSNRSIPGLGKEDFMVYEDNVRQEVAQVASTEAPFNLLLLLDVSGSTRSFIDLMKDASIDFTREIRENDRIAVATFNSDVRLVRDFTDDRMAVARAIQSIRSGGGTAFYDALLTSVDDYMRDIEGRKAIVVFTDGVDNALEGNISEGSRTPFDYLYRRIQEIDTIVYTIFLDTEGFMNVSRGGSSGSVVIDILGGVLGGGRAPRRNPYPGPSSRRGNTAVYEEARDQLLAIAEQTGGRMYAPRRIEDLAQTYSEIADDLRIQYLLGYNSTNPVRDGRWRAIHVEVHNHPEAAVRTRKGYYASAAETKQRSRRP